MAAEAEAEALVTHTGGCHCKAVRWEVDAPADLIVWDCNCSICAMKRNTHFIVPSARFRLLCGADALTEYTFNTHTAKHLFCKVCGVVSYYRPRSNPDGYAMTIYCVDPGTVRSVEVRRFDGQNWEGFIEGSGIRALSKTGDEEAAHRSEEAAEERSDASGGGDGGGGEGGETPAGK